MLNNNTVWQREEKIIYHTFADDNLNHTFQLWLFIILYTMMIIKIISIHRYDNIISQHWKVWKESVLSLQDQARPYLYMSSHKRWQNHCQNISSFLLYFLICFKWSNIILSITLTHLSVSNRSLVTSLWPRSYHLQMEKFHDPIYLYVHGMNFDVVRVWNSYPQLEVSYNV